MSTEHNHEIITIKAKIIGIRTAVDSEESTEISALKLSGMQNEFFYFTGSLEMKPEVGMDCKFLICTGCLPLIPYKIFNGPVAIIYSISLLESEENTNLVFELAEEVKKRGKYGCVPTTIIGNKKLINSEPVNGFRYIPMIVYPDNTNPMPHVYLAHMKISESKFQIYNSKISKEEISRLNTWAVDDMPVVTDDPFPMIVHEKVYTDHVHEVDVVLARVKSIDVHSNATVLEYGDTEYETLNNLNIPESLEIGQELFFGVFKSGMEDKLFSIDLSEKIEAQLKRENQEKSMVRFSKVPVSMEEKGRFACTPSTPTIRVAGKLRLDVRHRANSLTNYVYFVCFAEEDNDNFVSEPIYDAYFILSDDQVVSYNTELNSNDPRRLKPSTKWAVDDNVDSLESPISNISFTHKGNKVYPVR